MCKTQHSPYLLPDFFCVYSSFTMFFGLFTMFFVMGWYRYLKFLWFQYFISYLSFLEFVKIIFNCLRISYIHIVSFDQIHPIPTTYLISWTWPLFCASFVCSFYKTEFLQWCCYAHQYKLIYWSIPEANWFSFSHQFSVANNSSASSRNLRKHPLSCWDCSWLNLVMVLCMNSHCELYV